MSTYSVRRVRRRDLPLRAEFTVRWRQRREREGRAEGQGGAVAVAQTGEPRGHRVAVSFRALPGAHLGGRHPQGQGWGLHMIARLPPPIVRAGDTQQGVRSRGRAGVAACPGLGPPPVRHLGDLQDWGGGPRTRAASLSRGADGRFLCRPVGSPRRPP